MFYLIFFERQRVSRGGAERERETQNSEAGSGLRAVGTEPDVGLEPTLEP